MTRKRLVSRVGGMLMLLMTICSQSFAAIEVSDGDSVPDDLEKQLAEQFAPVLHKHPLDLQEGLADFNDAVLNHSTLKGVELPSGRELYKKRTPPLHVKGPGATWDSLGSGSIPAYWIIDINDDISFGHKGASTGNRPLYYHVYKEGNFFYVQYWYFFTMNDIRTQTRKKTWHEGDWEHVSIRVKQDGEKFLPDAINFHQHFGGKTVDPSEAWWSGSKDLHDPAQGYFPQFRPCPPGVLCKRRVTPRTHLHIWIARNSHASFNRYDDIFVLDAFGNIPFNDNPQVEHFVDEVDYSRTDLVFDYDTLVNMGEVRSSLLERTSKGELFPRAHSLFWFEHYEHHRAKDSPSIEGLAFIGDLGRYWVSGANSVVPPGCKDAATVSPRSPFFPDMEHQWRSFTFNHVGFGNPDVICDSISFLASFATRISWKPFTGLLSNGQITPVEQEFYDSGLVTPAFHIKTLEGLYYSYEVATDNMFFKEADFGHLRDETNFFSSWWGGPSATREGSIAPPLQLRATASDLRDPFGVPFNFWRNAQIDGVLYYRLIVSTQKAGTPSTPRKPVPIFRSTKDSNFLNAPFITVVPRLKGDIDVDRDVDQNDLRRILAARNTDAQGTDDPRDLDGDGRITVLDARKLVLLCTRPRCATE